LARELLSIAAGEVAKMEAVVIAATLCGSFIGAWALQRAALEGLFRMMEVERRVRQ
jgi:hypothetical protein